MSACSVGDTVISLSIFIKIFEVEQNVVIPDPFSASNVDNVIIITFERTLHWFFNYI